MKRVISYLFVLHVDGRSMREEMLFRSHHSDPSVLRCVFVNDRRLQATPRNINRYAPKWILSWLQS